MEYKLRYKGEIGWVEDDLNKATRGGKKVTNYTWNIICQKCEGNCGLWVFDKIMIKNKNLYWKIEKNRGSRLGDTC